MRWLHFHGLPKFKVIKKWYVSDTAKFALYIATNCCDVWLDRRLMSVGMGPWHDVLHMWHTCIDTMDSSAGLPGVDKNTSNSQITWPCRRNSDKSDLATSLGIWLQDQDFHSLRPTNAADQQKSPKNANDLNKKLTKRRVRLYLNGFGSKMLYTLPRLRYRCRHTQAFFAETHCLTKLSMAALFQAHVRL